MTTPRIAPGGVREIGPVNAGLAWTAGLVAGHRKPLHLFSTLARHRRLFRPWLRFAARLMPFGTLPRADAELVILRVAVNCGSDYEWFQHAPLSRKAGLSPADQERVRQGTAAPGWTARQAALLRAADELHAERRIGDETWTALAGELSSPQLIELCMLVGHYEMLAMTLNSLRVQPER